MTTTKRKSKKTTVLLDFNGQVGGVYEVGTNTPVVDWDKEWNDAPKADTKEIEIPHLRGGDWKWNFEKSKMPWYDKVTWVLTSVNVAILISLFISH